MTLATLLADDGSTVSDYVQNGNIPALQIISVSDQRLGARQPMFAQTGRRGRRVNVEFKKTNTTSLATATADRDQLEQMQGQRVVITSQFAETIEVFCHSMSVTVKVGAGKWLVMATMECEAMPASTTNPTTP